MTGPDDPRGVPPGARSGGYQPAGLPVPPPARIPGAPEPARLFGVVIALLGALNFLFGFLPELTSTRIDAALSVYAVGPAYAPILLLIAGLLALAAVMSGADRSWPAVAAVSVGGAAGALISLGTDGPVQALTSATVSKGMGAVLLAIVGVVQAVVAIAAYVVGGDLRIGSRTAGPNAVPAADSRSPFMDPATGPIRPVGFPSIAPTGHASGPPGHVPDPSVAYYAGWAPPPDDDRPTGPQRSVDATGVEPDERQGPAERELPRVVPERRDQPPSTPDQPPSTPDLTTSPRPGPADEPDPER